MDDGVPVPFRPSQTISQGFAFVPTGQLGEGAWSACMRERNRITYAAYSADCIRRNVTPLSFKECVR